MNNVASVCAIGFFCALTGCINKETNLYEVTLNGQISVVGMLPSNGEVHLEFHHAESVGDGELAHPLGEFDRQTMASIGPARNTLLYPKDDGAGLIVYGWLDADGDGILCAPGKPRSEPAGLVRVSGFPAHTLSYALVLDTVCAGPESLYP
jgi:hypothetical protein